MWLFSLNGVVMLGVFFCVDIWWVGLWFWWCVLEVVR